MEIATEGGHRLLAYISAATRRGAILSPDNLEAYAKSPFRRMRRTSSFQDFVATLGNLTGKSEPLETWTQYLERVGWIKVASESVKLTPLGHAILADLSAPKLDVTNEDASEVILDPSDPFAYVRVIGALSDIGEGLLVDPYFRFDQLETVVEHTQIRRILTSKKIGAPAISQLALALAVYDEPQRPEVRVANELHDRFAISEGDKVIAIGTSLNSVGKNLSIVVPLASIAGNAIRRSHEDLWSSASVLEPKKPAQQTAETTEQPSTAEPEQS
ncbi:hypothetical protein ACFUZA_01315 [Streptomyces cellulosae]|uniref:hypothetical protein n=1 Tax=Streptomyces cellulosae TaxID=1968 RepID=UPI00369DC56B